MTGPDDPVPSPCTGLCTLDADEVCLGCGRTIDDIATWILMNPAAQRRAIAAAERRLAERRANPD